MPEIYRTTAMGAGGERTPVVIHCSDPRYQPHFQQFLREGLKLEHYALLAVPGGAQFLTLAEYLPKFSWVGWRWAKFVMDVAQPERVVLIAHQDCRWYADPRFGMHPCSVRERQTADVAKVREAFAQRFGAVHIESYYARLDGERAVFETV